jgi:hypothetical protein
MAPPRAPLRARTHRTTCPERSASRPRRRTIRGWPCPRAWRPRPSWWPWPPWRPWPRSCRRTEPESAWLRCWGVRAASIFHRPQRKNSHIRTFSPSNPKPSLTLALSQRRCSGGGTRTMMPSASVMMTASAASRPSPANFCDRRPLAERHALGGSRSSRARPWGSAGRPAVRRAPGVPDQRARSTCQINPDRRAMSNPHTTHTHAHTRTARNPHTRTHAPQAQVERMHTLQHLGIPLPRPAPSPPRSPIPTPPSPPPAGHDTVPRLGRLVPRPAARRSRTSQPRPLVPGQGRRRGPGKRGML